MSPIEALVAEVSKGFAIGPAAGSLVQGLLQFVFGESKGLKGLLDLFAANGLGGLASSWIGRTDNPALSPQGVTQAFGGEFIADLARKVGLDPGVATAALAFIVPKLVGLLTPNGTIPTAAPPAVAAFLSAPAAPAATPATPMPNEGMFRAAAAPEPVARTGRGEDTAGVNRYIFPGVALLLAAGFIYHFLTNRPETPAPAATPTASATAPDAPSPAPAASVAVATGPAHFAFFHDSQSVVASGVVADEATRSAILDALKSAFGASAMSGLKVDPSVAAAPWTARLSDALAALKAPNLHATFEGAKIAVGGAVPTADLDAIIARLKALFGGSVEVARLNVSELPSTFDVAALRENFSGQNLAGALNAVTLNFASGSAVIDDHGEIILLRAAELIKKLPAATIVHIGGYTDQTGDPAANVVLSQRRADAVRKVLIDAGVPEASLTSKGYGGGASTTSGTNRTDRRIEFTVGQ